MKLNEDTVLPLLKNETKYHKIAEKALNNVIEPFPNIGEVTFDSNFDWKYRPDPTSDTFQLYLQNLRIVSVLIDYFRSTEDLKAVLKAKEFTESWIDYIDNEEATNMTWYDHTTANRTQTIIEFMYICKLSNIPLDEDKYHRIIKKHADVLTDDSIHKNNNHALMMDRSLMMLGIILENEFYFLKGLDRAKTVFWVSFSAKGIHLENSPAYHFMVFRIYKEIELYLNKNNKSLGEEILRMFPLLEKYKSYIAKPNNVIPPLGDSGRIQLNNSDYNWSSISDSAAGISVIKNKDNNFYMAFVAGFSSHVHKHSDDLSFVLTYKNRDFFEDAGMFGYGSNKSRNFVKSYEGHTIFSTGETYSKNRDNKVNQLVYTDQYLNSNLFTIVSGYNKAYKNAKLRRTLYYIPEVNVLIGHDVGESKVDQNWMQNFNLSEEVIVERQDNNYKLINSEESIYLTFLNHEKSVIIAGDKNVPKAVNSNKPGNLVETYQIRNVHKKTNRFDQTFLVRFDSLKDILIEKNEGSMILYVEGKTYTLPIFEI